MMTGIVEHRQDPSEDWVNDCGEAPRDVLGNTVSWLLTPFALVVEWLAERFGWW